jgi:hypothetical protein
MNEGLLGLGFSVRTTENLRHSFDKKKVSLHVCMACARRMSRVVHSCPIDGFVVFVQCIQFNK